MKTFSAALIDAKNRHHSANPLVWLYRVSIDGVPANDLFLANFKRDLSYDPGDGGGVRTWLKSSLILEDVSESSGSLSEVRVSLQNVDRDAANRLELGQIMDRRIEALLVSLEDLGAAGHHDSQKWSVRKATVGERVVTFMLGQFPYLTFIFPAERYVRDRCPFVHEGTVNPVFDGRCGAIATLTTCDKSFEGAAGCAGNNNQRRFGGHPELLVGPHPLLGSG